MTTIKPRHRDELVETLAAFGRLLHSSVPNQIVVQITDPESLDKLARFLADDSIDDPAGGFHLASVVGNDERHLEDRRFKIYYVFAGNSEDLYIHVEYLLARGAIVYPSIHTHFRSVDPFEWELIDMLGLHPSGERRYDVRKGSRIHDDDVRGFHPLRRDHETDRRCTSTKIPTTPIKPVQSNVSSTPTTESVSSGSLILPVGPVHAGIIEPGRFLFTISGEIISDLEIQLGYTHRGIERLFQNEVGLMDGWRLAEQVSGDSSFAHSMAYCRAVETLTETKVPEGGRILRAVLLEMERIHNHIADIAALARDVALLRLASELEVVRERLLRLNLSIAGHRYLRALNRPGGLDLPHDIEARWLRRELADCLTTFEPLAEKMKGNAGFRNRAIGVGAVTRQEARQLGLMGPAARASGVERDLRWRDPIVEPFALDRGEPHGDSPNNEAVAGDVYARFLIRVNEVHESAALIDNLLDRQVSGSNGRGQRLMTTVRLRPRNNYTFAVGYAEGFRGAVVYWVMQDKLGGIYRCKVCDPSMFNWPALRTAVQPRTIGGRYVETLVPDFPLINKSLNQSYAGHDL